MVILDKQMLVGKISFVLGEKYKLAWLFCGTMYVLAENSKMAKAFCRNFMRALMNVGYIYNLFFSPVALIR
jgi:hypothetical protein